MSVLRGEKGQDLHQPDLGQPDTAVELGLDPRSSRSLCTSSTPSLGTLVHSGLPHMGSEAAKLTKKTKSRIAKSLGALGEMKASHP